MTRMTPAKYVAEMKNAPGDGAATPHATEGVQPTTQAQEIVMPNHTPPRSGGTNTDQIPTEWVRERITFLRDLADKAGDHGIAAGLESAALVLETELSSYRNGGAS